MFASMVADVVDEQEAQVSRRQEGVFSSAIGFSAKATTSLGLILGGFLLDYVVAFPRGTQPGEVESATLIRLAVTDGIAVPILFALPIYLLSRYTLTRERLTQIQANLKRT
jgi:Na+/melibiose symporter-like transporter